MNQIEYTVLNMSEIATKIKAGNASASIVSVLNEYGAQGWEVVTRLTDASFLLKRPKTDEVIPTVNKYFVPHGFKLVKAED